MRSDFIKNFKSLRCVCLWAGGLGLIQSLIWSVLIVAGICTYHCMVAVNDTFNYATLIPVVFMELYLMSGCSHTIPAYNNTMLLKVKTVLSPQDIFLLELVYLVLVVCWVLASILLITYPKQNRPCGVKAIIWSWMLITFAICALDLACGIIFGIDYKRFNLEAHKYNLSGTYAGEIYADAAQLLVGMLVSMIMVIISFKGFVLWIINFSLLVYLGVRAAFIRTNNSDTINISMPRIKTVDIMATRPAIHAYDEEVQKPSILSTAFSNEGFEHDYSLKRISTRPGHPNGFNSEIIDRAARIATSVSGHKERFHNLDNYQQYPPPPAPQLPVRQQSQQDNPPISFPEPDYTPPMHRACQHTKPNKNFNSKILQSV